MVLGGKWTESRNLVFWTEKRNPQFWTEFGRKTGKWPMIAEKIVKFFHIHWLYRNVFCSLFEKTDA